ncbi:SDR family NAD(P)-dependent oxidoreductase [Parafrankia sp. EUN1f]|uniref:SDR family NAD(P)-dependent oxidoreductase n=1 Tax=Parafrankia sp. EUN1f TaxID=102897 RepID=UPI0001C45E6F|nr:SDR family NAD(P)-dependent oxidoreductase [Parafrankia sp. EUN1f]EFC82772.1 short-chain dehydrogenase/reductase SDR [Parafrankia sp. EUN1f]
MTTAPHARPAGAVLITGSGSGIGAATAVAAAQAGYRVVATVYSLDRAEDLRARIAAGGPGLSVDIRELDVTREEQIAAVVADVVTDYGALHGVISNAGVTLMATFESESLASYRRVFEVNFFGPVAVLKQAMPHLRASGGRIIAVGSINGVLGLPFQESYGASKFALEGLLESLAPVARRLGVAVSVVSPGHVSGTAIFRDHDPNRFLAEAPEPYGAVIDEYFGNWSSGDVTDVPATQPVTEVAEIIVGVLASADPGFRYTTSPAGHQLLAHKLLDPTGNALARRIGGWLDPTTRRPVPVDGVPVDGEPADGVAGADSDAVLR